MKPAGMSLREYHIAVQRAAAEKREGMARAAEARAVVLARAKELAHSLAKNGRQVTADDVQFALSREGISPAILGPAAGSLFKGKEWECTGFVASSRVSNHACMIRVWRLRK